MKQLLQNFATGETNIIIAPRPSCGRRDIIVQMVTSLISAGTERMLMNFSKANLIKKAMSQPEKVRQVINKVKTDGLSTTYGAVRSKLSDPIPMGYSAAGVVVETGDAVTRFKVGDRVALIANHAQLAKAKETCMVRVPDSVSMEDASFVVLSSIALQGVRLAKPDLGEYFVVSGLGLIGLITVQILLASGCRVLGLDFNKQRLNLAESYGAQVVDLSTGINPVDAAQVFSNRRGVDGVLVAAASKESSIIRQAAEMCRVRGRVICIGVVGLNLEREPFFRKEIEFRVSHSFGPGRHDSKYEGMGQDYPFGFVRWTENRNFEAILDMMADGRLDVKPLISYRFSFDDAIQAYDKLSKDQEALGIILQYRDVPQEELMIKQVTLKEDVSFNVNQPVCGFIGAGNYASRILIPAYAKAGAQLHTIVSSGGVSATHHGKKNGFHKAVTDVSEMLDSDEINTIVVVTRHNTHAQYVIDALRRGKNVFVEKPLALNDGDLDAIEQAYRENANPAGVRLMVGFNRRFAPQIKKMKVLLQTVNQPKSFIMTMNAGAIPADTWIQDIEIGGGRIIGEACHYVDLMRHLAGTEIVSVQARRMGKHPGLEVVEDKAAIILGFSDGSFGTIHYLANGGKAFPKERIEVFAGNGVLQLNNFRKLKGFGWRNFKKMNLLRQDKGQQACVAAFLESIEKGQPAPITFDELMEVSRVTIEAARQLRYQT